MKTKENNTEEEAEQEAEANKIIIVLKRIKIKTPKLEEYET